jgi:hypothetical protein
MGKIGGLPCKAIPTVSTSPPRSTTIPIYIPTSARKKGTTRKRLKRLKTVARSGRFGPFTAGGSAVQAPGERRIPDGAEGERSAVKYCKAWAPSGRSRHRFGAYPSSDRRRKRSYSHRLCQTLRASDRLLGPTRTRKPAWRRYLPVFIRAHSRTIVFRAAGSRFATAKSRCIAAASG